MFRRLDNFDGPIFGMLIGLHIWRKTYIWGRGSYIRRGILTGFYGIFLNAHISFYFHPSTYFFHHFNSYAKIPILISLIPIPNHRIPTLIFHIRNPIPRIHTLIPCIPSIPNMIPRIPIIRFPDSPFWLLQTAKYLFMQPGLWVVQFYYLLR